MSSTGFRLQWVVVALVTAAAALQLTTFVLADKREYLGFLVKLVIAGLLPHVMVGAVALATRWTTLLLPSLALMLLADVAAFLSVFVWPRDAQAPLLLLFMPLWNLLVVLPAGMVLSLVGRYCWRRWRGTDSRR